jgi:galactokinase
MSEILGKVIDAFRAKYSAEPDVVAMAPGRVNLIGEHTDYTGGFVLPVAIDREVVIAVKKTPGNKIKGYSLDYDQAAEIEAGDYDRKHPSNWLRYDMGVLSELEKAGKKIPGFSFTIGGNVPIGSGLSSSAAVEMAVCTAMEGLLGFNLADKEAALLCQRAENHFVGVNCGIMDQYISRVGKKDHAVLIDCTDLSTNRIKINTPGYTWLIIDSKKKRGLVDSEYNKRRQECEEGLKSAQTAFPGRKIGGLRDISTEDLETLKNSCEPIVFNRVKHIVTENDRVLKTVKALEAGDSLKVGECLYGSHASLRDDFQVSCSELDTLVDILSGVNGVAGARLTGAGFGGCVIVFLKEESVDKAREAILKKYHPDFLPKDKSAEIWPIKISDGSRVVSV